MELERGSWLLPKKTRASGKVTSNIKPSTQKYMFSRGLERNFLTFLIIWIHAVLKHLSSFLVFDFTQCKHIADVQTGGKLIIHYATFKHTLFVVYNNLELKGKGLGKRTF